MGPGRFADEYVHSHGRKVEEVMTPDPQTISEDTPLDEIVQTMEKHGIKRVPVVRGKRLVGIVSRANLLHALASLAPAAPGAQRERRRHPRPALGRTRAIRNGPRSARSTSSCATAIVELWGTITDERERQALIVAAENIPGVKAVRDHLAWVEPNSGMVFYPPGDEPGRAASGNGIVEIAAAGPCVRHGPDACVSVKAPWAAPAAV